MKTLYLNSYHADGSLYKKSRIIGIEKRPEGFIPTAYRLHLEAGESAIAPTIKVLRGWIKDGNL